MEISSLDLEIEVSLIPGEVMTLSMGRAYPQMPTKWKNMEKNGFLIFLVAVVKFLPDFCTLFQETSPEPPSWILDFDFGQG